jgi:hypothetical protein
VGGAAPCAVGPHANLHAVGWGLTGVYPCAVGGVLQGVTPVGGAAPCAVGPHANLHAVGWGLTGVYPCKTPAYGKSVLKIEVRTRRRPSRKPSCRRPGGSRGTESPVGGSRGFTPVQKIEVENNH